MTWLFPYYASSPSTAVEIDGDIPTEILSFPVDEPDVEWPDPDSSTPEPE